jgi:Kef-type K+ transport system membrane component KefB
VTSIELGSVALALGVFLLAAHAFGYIFERFRQPPLIGEILAGVALAPFFSIYSKPVVGTTLHFVYWFGLMLLMFISGSSVKHMLSHENRKPVAWILAIGTPLPFFLVLGLGLAGLLPLAALTGPAGNKISTLLILAIAVAVTSIPVISRIFHDLGIMNTRFAGLILSSAVLEDIILWGVLAVATSIASAADYGDIGTHVGAALAYTALGLFAAPKFLRLLHQAPWNFLRKRSPVGYILVILLAYAALAAALDVSLVFAAFLAGFGVAGGLDGEERPRFADPLEAITKVAFGFFIPIYFALVGYKLVLGRDFSFVMLAGFLLGSSLLCLISVGLAAKLAGFRGLDILNLAVVTNARGGPGIVLASVAYEKGIINAAFYTTLVLTAVITSQTAGLWLRHVLSRGWPLLSENNR